MNCARATPHFRPRCGGDLTAVCDCNVLLRGLALLVVLLLLARLEGVLLIPIDYSLCGYAAQTRPIPNAPVRIVVSPASGDSTCQIQLALDYVGGLSADTNGLRGAVLLLAGRYEINGSLRLTNSGVVLRGQGIENTTLVATGTDRRTVICVVGQPANPPSRRIPLSDCDIPVGATSVPVIAAEEFIPGSLVRVVRPSTTK